MLSDIELVKFILVLNWESLARGQYMSKRRVTKYALSQGKIILRTTGQGEPLSI
jgi:hypothetical protein